MNEYRWFIFFLVMGTVVSLLLLAIRALSVKKEFSWFAVPLPFLLGIAIDAHSFIYWSIRFQMLAGQ